MSASEQELHAARMAGRDAQINGADTTNCHFRHFRTPELTAAWTKGKCEARYMTRVPNDPQAAEREHAPVPVPNGASAAELVAWLDGEIAEMEKETELYPNLPHLRTISRLLSTPQDAELVKLRAEVARLQARTTDLEQQLVVALYAARWRRRR